MRFKELFTVPEGKKVTEKVFGRVLVSSICSMLLCMSCLVGTTWALFAVSVENTDNLIVIGTADESDVKVTVNGTEGFSSGSYLPKGSCEIYIENCNPLDDLNQKATLYVTLMFDRETAGYVKLCAENEYSATVTGNVTKDIALSWTISWFQPEGAEALENMISWLDEDTTEESTETAEPTEGTTTTTESTEESTEATEATEESTADTDSAEETTETTASTEEPTADADSAEETTAATESTEEATSATEATEGTMAATEATEETTLATEATEGTTLVTEATEKSTATTDSTEESAAGLSLTNEPTGTTEPTVNSLETEINSTVETTGSTEPESSLTENAT